MSDIISTPASLEELLRFYAESGVDEALEDAPVDRFVLSAKAAPPAAPAPAPRAELPSLRQDAPRAPAPAIPASVPDEAQAARARDMARSARTLDELRDILSAFDGCNLKA